MGITDARAQIYRGTSSAALLTTYQLDADVTLAQLAQAAGVSVFHFACTFTSPSRYVSRMRLERAMPDIAAGKLSLAEVAFKAGFSSQASFTRVIYRVTGVTPGNTARTGDLPRGPLGAQDPLKAIARTDKTGLGDTPNIDHAHHPERDMQD